MKHLLLTTIAAVVLVGCGESQQSAPAPETKPVKPVAEAASPEPPTAKAPDIDIHTAAMTGNIEAVKQHLDAGTDVNAKDNLDMTPLDYAVTPGKEEMADLLRKNGGRSAAYDSIHLAAMLGNIEAVKQHLADGADVDAKDEDGETSLHRAAKFGHKEIAELLISNGADVNAKSEGYESTPLHHAAWAGYAHKEVTELLIAKGADVNAKNNIGITPLDAAITRSHTEIADLLRKHGGKTAEELKAEGK
jgi:ankyrin repeat protein